MPFLPVRWQEPEPFQSLLLLSADLFQVVPVMVHDVVTAGRYCRSAPLQVEWCRGPVPVADHESPVVVRYPLQKMPFVERVQGTECDAVVIVPDDLKILSVYGCEVGWFYHWSSFPMVLVSQSPSKM